MPGVEGMAEITVEVPARAEYVHVFRTVVASVAARLNFPIEGIDDLRIAVDEAFAHLLGVKVPAADLRMRILAEDGRVEVVASSGATPAEWPATESTRMLTWQVLSALADEAVFERAEGRPAIRFVKRLESRPS